MSNDLSGPISAYFKGKAEHDIDAMLAPFDEHATVKDDGHEYSGPPAIRAWMEDVARKYDFTVEVKGVTNARDKTVVSALLSGNFPGSPVLLDHTFTLSDSRIARLEIE